MTNGFVIYISAAADLAAEREILGRAVAEVPVDLPMRVIQSPGGNGPVDLDGVINADLHILVMGGDIRAPVGLEWQVARRYGRHPLAYVKGAVLHTPAGRDFIRLVAEVQTWVPFADGAALRRQVLQVIARHLLEHAAYHGLKPDEMARLRQWRDSLAAETGPADQQVRGGAGDSAILISRERFEPSDGILLGDNSS